MKMLKSAAVAFAACALWAPLAGAQTNARGDEAFAYATAFQATVYGFPLVGMYARLSEETLDPVTRKAPFNAYFHYRELATPSVSPFPAPNNDTLYSTAWLDLRSGPILLSVPDTGGRYYTAQILDMATETITNVGRRLDGTGAGDFLVVGPDWNGAPPPGVKRVIRSQTSIAYVLLRVLVDGPDDVPAVTALQDRFTIAPLSREGGAKPAPLPVYAARDGRGHLDVLDRVIRLGPTRAEDAGMVASFAPIGVGPAAASLKIRGADDTLARAEADARAFIASVGARTGVFVNGWRKPAGAIGRYGVDYMQRASVWDGGPLANVPEESFYPAALLDSANRPLDGSKARYRLRVAKDQTPPVDAFWSITMYKLDDKLLVANPINRYSIGNRTRGLKLDADGSMTIPIQVERPSNADTPNWLPAPRQPFYLVLRLYGPRPAAISGEWRPPAIEQITQ